MRDDIKRGIDSAKKKLIKKMGDPDSKEKLNEIIGDEIEYEKLITELEAVKRCAPLEKGKIEMLESKVNDMESYMEAKYSKGFKVRRVLNYVTIGIGVLSIIISINTLASQHNRRAELENEVALLEHALVMRSLGDDSFYNEIRSVSWHGNNGEVCISTLDRDKILTLGQAIEYSYGDDYIIDEIKKLVDGRNFAGNVEVSYHGDEVWVKFFGSHRTHQYSSIFEVFRIYGEFDNIIDEVQNEIRRIAQRDGQAVYWISDSEIEINYNNEINVYTLDEAREKFKDNPDILSEIENAAKLSLAYNIQNTGDRFISVYWTNDTEIKIIIDGNTYIVTPDEALEMFKDDEYIVNKVNELLKHNQFRKDIDEMVARQMGRDGNSVKTGNEGNPIIQIPEAVYDVANSSEKIKAFEQIYNTLENELVYDEAYAEGQKRLDLKNGLSAYETKKKDIERTKTDKKGVCTTFAMRLSDELDKLGMSNYLSYSISSDGLIHWFNVYFVDGEWFVADITNDIVQGNYAKELYGDFGTLPALSHNVPLSTYMKQGSSYYVVEPIRNDDRLMSEYSVLPMDVFISQFGISAPESSSFSR